ncbi:hypothetical protein [Pararhizobium antarcticum]|uniref:Uncharacterized protein n=1 Tax=Pararhizobium antarcticum TaxID=1798805 RepID=A0A657LX56_9HYPH|nr:hypothetical protein [Pararhizobium antarcticum]OJF97412.1 hypothetical protein AX760_16960 [Pararhizobium antarcticum]
MDEDALAACCRFPTRAGAIVELSVRDEEFRDLCADFATAEAELHRWRGSNHVLRDQRVSEYAVLVEALAGEIVSMLENASVVPFPRR